ncbi:hypothetical protein [Phenylobacterium montanum]|uniref:Porin n=1 Tax=Phenylobacterium montanum TaxID=2823693 RepID=A0A975G4M5_9CAUL|nr:hypothetical protein [Caulobacter sp. S6]QUD90447.1 hypothetical protein KCG34_11575 [Caulobacter sp. S6]
MRTKSSLLCSVACGVVLAVGMGAAAQAKTSKKHHHHEAAAPAPAGATAEEVKALADEVESLKARLDQEQMAREQTEAKAQAAEAEASAAKADASAARTQLAEQIQTLPGEVKQAVVANTPKPGWWGDTKVGATVFADISDINQKTPGALAATGTTAASNGYPADNGYGFDIKRAYLIVDHKFNDTYSANLTTDFLYDGTTKATQLFMKKAYLQAKYSDALVVRAGITDMPWVPFVENIYGYRYVENVLIDRLKYGTSADTGITVSGNFDFKPVKVGYSLGVIDGSGYKAPDVGNFNRTKKMDLEGRLNVSYENFTAAIGGYEGDLGKDVNGVTVNHTANRFDALLAYVDTRFRVGGEYVSAKDITGVTTAKPVKANADGYSAFGSFNITDKIALFGRYDWVNPERDATTASNKTNSASRDEYFNVGLSYTPVKGVDVAMVYKRDSVTNGLLVTSNGAAAPASVSAVQNSTTFITTANASPQGSGIIGGLNGGNGAYDEFGIFMRYQF